MMTPQQDSAWVVQCRKRARDEGLSVIDGNIWYRNPAGLNGEGCQFSGTEQTGYLLGQAGRIQDVGLCELTHLLIKEDGNWCGVCISLGQVLDCFKLPRKRYGLNQTN
jgi:hypothetical protein